MQEKLVRFKNHILLISVIVLLPPPHPIRKWNLNVSLIQILQNPSFSFILESVIECSSLLQFLNGPYVNLAWKQPSFVHCFLLLVQTAYSCSRNKLNSSLVCHCCFKPSLAFIKSIPVSLHHHCHGRHSVANIQALSYWNEIISIILIFFNWSVQLPLMAIAVFDILLTRCSNFLLPYVSFSPILFSFFFLRALRTVPLYTQNLLCQHWHCLFLFFHYFLCSLHIQNPSNLFCSNAPPFYSFLQG